MERLLTIEFQNVYKLKYKPVFYIMLVCANGLKKEVSSFKTLIADGELQSWVLGIIAWVLFLMTKVRGFLSIPAIFKTIPY